MSDGSCHATDRGEAILASRSLFETAYLRQILERNHHAGGHASLSRQWRDAVAETKTHAFRRRAVRFKSRTPVAILQRAHRCRDVLLQLAEKDRSIFTANRLFLVSSDLFCRDIEREDAPVQIGGNQAGANRRHDTFVQRAQVGQRLRCRGQAHV